MFGRVLLVTLQQALRSIALVLFPLTFIALVAWATAGSSSGNTTDPIRSAAWLWLGSYLVPFVLHLAPAHAPGLLSVMPIGGAIFPVLAARSGFKRSVIALGSERAARIFFSLWMALFGAAAAWLSATGDIKASLSYAPAYVLVITVLATINYRSQFFAFLRIPLALAAIVAGVASIAIGVSLAAHFSITKNLTVLLEPGWIGGALLLALQVLYIPNFIITMISYGTGLGFSLGSGTHISPLHVTLHQIPAIPIMGALPSGKHPLYLLSIALIVLCVAVLIVNIKRSYVGIKDQTNWLAWTRLISGVFVLVLSFLSAGELLTPALNPVGVTWWKPAAYLIFVELITSILILYIPAGVRALLNRRSHE